jgi:hypothetical protein
MAGKAIIQIIRMADVILIDAPVIQNIQVVHGSLFFLIENDK